MTGKENKATPCKEEFILWGPMAAKHKQEVTVSEKLVKPIPLGNHKR